VTLCLGCALAARPAAAGESSLIGAADVMLGSGHDTNMFLAVRPELAAGGELVAGWFGRAAPALSLALARSGWRSELSYDLDFRYSDAGGALALHQGEWSVLASALGRWQPRLAASAGRFFAHSRGDEDFWFTGGEAGLGLELASAFHVRAGLRAERRFPAAPASPLWLYQAETRARWRPQALFAAGLGGSYVRLAATEAGEPGLGGGALTIVRVGPDTRLTWRGLTWRAGAWYGRLHDAGAGVRDWQVGAATSLLVRVTDRVDVAASFDWSSSVRTAGLQPDRYSRRVFMAGLVGHASTRKLYPGSAPPLAPALEGRRVRFLHRAPDASEVRVIGSWDGWTAASAMARAGADLWEVSLELPAGTHRYRFVQDGKAVEPGDAAGYVADDFGGRDGLVEVGGAKEAR
jgi:hypothetical protein